jgi:glycosyltransferase involved in cell wall biosynthesis
MTICMLVPAYNESKTIADVVRGCRTYVPDVLVVDDGSRDDTAAIAENAGASVIVHETNRGKGAALKTGFEHIINGRWDALIVIDADGQHDWHEIPAIMDTTLRDNAAITIGSRMSDVATMPIHRRMSNWLTSRIISSLAGQYVPDSQCGFRLIRTCVLKELDLSTDNFEMESEMIILAGRMGYRVSSVPIRTIYVEGRERIGPGRDTLRFIKLFALHLLGLR